MTIPYRPRLRRLAAPVLMLSAALAAMSCNNREDCKVDSSYDPVLNPGAFQVGVDNSYFPLASGTRFTYAEGTDTVVVDVLLLPKVILGVSCVTVHDVATSGGEIIEDTYDWFAQDTTGAVWYFGEDTKELSHGTVVSTEGSWEGGVDGAKPGILIPADPLIGQTYRQEYYACVAEDMGEILDLNASAVVPSGSYTGCLKTRDFTALEPDLNEQKYYAPGVGLVLTVDVNSGSREVLVKVEHFDLGPAAP